MAHPRKMQLRMAQRMTPIFVDEDYTGRRPGWWRRKN